MVVRRAQPAYWCVSWARLQIFSSGPMPPTRTGALIWRTRSSWEFVLRWVASLLISLLSQFIVGTRNIVADSLSRRQHVLGSKWTLAFDVVTELQARLPVMVDLFATSLNYCLPVYFSPFADPMAAGTDAFLQSWDGLQAYAFPPFVFIQQVPNKLCTCKGTLLTLIAPYWTQRE